MLRQGDEPIPGYRLERFLGKGQFGEVWMSTSPGKTHAALKFLDLSGKQGWKEFNGIQHVKRIRHAHLMPITALWLLDNAGNVLGDAVLDEIETQTHVETESGSKALAETISPEKTVEQASEATVDSSVTPKWLIVANLLGDKSLLDVLIDYRDQGKQGIPIDELIRYMEEAAKGIDFLNSPKHDFGSGPVAMQHCDIKPANMLLVGDSVLICDFGVSRVLGDSGVSSTATGMVGSMAYMSPECIDRKPSFASDQYSLAISYVELRTGELPFKDKSFQTVLITHQTGEFDFSGVSQAETEVLKKATAREPSDRFATAFDFVQALKQAVSPKTQPTADAPSTPILPIIATAVVLIGLSIGAFVFFSGNGDSNNNGNGKLPPQRVKNEYRLVVEPSADVKIDGEVRQPDDDGVIAFQRFPEDRISINAGGDDRYQLVELEISISDFHDGTYKIEMKEKASYLASLAMHEFRNGNFEAATKKLAEAIGSDRIHAAVPQPVVIDHEGEIIEAICLTSDGTSMITATGAGVVRHVDLTDASGTSRELLNQKDIEFERIYRGKYVIALTTFDDQLWTIDLSSQSPARRIQGHGDSLRHLAISSDDRWLAAISYLDDVPTVQIWDVRQENAGPTALEADFMERLMFLNQNQWFAAAGEGKVHIWETEKLAEKPRTFDVRDRSIRSIAAAPTYIAVGGEQESEDRQCHATILPLKQGEAAWELPHGHEDHLEVIAVNSTGEKLATGGGDKNVHYWEIKNRDAGSPVVFAGDHDQTIIGLAFDSTEEWLISTSTAQVFLHELADENQQTLELGPTDARCKQSFVSGDDKWVAVLGQDGKVRIWDLQHCKMIKRACDLANVSSFIQHSPPPSVDLDQI